MGLKWMENAVFVHHSAKFPPTGTQKLPSTGLHASDREAVTPSSPLAPPLSCKFINREASSFSLKATIFTSSEKFSILRNLGKRHANCFGSSILDFFR